VWAERGSRPRAPRDQRYDWAYLFGAVCPARDAGAALVLPGADSEAMNLHLAEISRNVTPGSHAVVLLDGAGWHQTGGKLELPENISLLKLPAYSPELNPVENIWEYLRQNRLSNRVFESYDAIVDACCDAWNALTAEPGRIQSIGAPCYAGLELIVQLIGSALAAFLHKGCRWVAPNQIVQEHPHVQTSICPP
jgi:transposase